MNSLKTVEKHFIEEAGRSQLCYGERCKFCRDGIEKRQRHNVQLLVNGQRFSWEFGDDVLLSLQALQSEDGFTRCCIARLGAGRKTRYQISVKPAGVKMLNRFTSGKYGHMIQQ